MERSAAHDLPPEKRTEPVEPVSQRPRPGVTRCPFCHQDCAPDAEACACAECLSRHHSACWDEGRGCASCRSTRRLEPPRASQARSYDDIFAAWLKLGLIYDGALAAITVLYLGRLLPRVLIEVGVGAVAANLCFLVAPALDLIARRLGYRGKALRWIMFFLGFLFAVILTLDNLSWLYNHYQPQ